MCLLWFLMWTHQEQRSWRWRLIKAAALRSWRKGSSSGSHLHLAPLNSLLIWVSTLWFSAIRHFWVRYDLEPNDSGASILVLVIYVIDPLNGYLSIIPYKSCAHTYNVLLFLCFAARTKKLASGPVAVGYDEWCSLSLQIKVLFPLICWNLLWDFNDRFFFRMKRWQRV